MELDPHLCYKRNVHNRKLEDIEVICTNFYPTPAHHIQLDATTLLQSGAITEVQMEDADDEVVMEDAQESEVRPHYRNPKKYCFYEFYTTLRISKPPLSNILSALGNFFLCYLVQTSCQWM